METYTKDQIELLLEIEFNRGFKAGFENAVEVHCINTEFFTKEKA